MASSIVNVEQWVQGGFARAQYAISSSGLPYDSTAVPAQDAGVGMTRLYGAKTANVTLPPAEILQITGDDSVRGAIQFPGNALPTFDLTFADTALGFLDKTQGTTMIDAQTTYDIAALDPADRTFPDIFLLLTQRAVSTQAGKEGNGYNNMIFPLCTLGLTTLPNMATGANEGTVAYTVTVNRVTQTPWGETLSTGTHGTTGASGFWFWSQNIPTMDVYKQSAAGGTYSPTQTVNTTTEQVIAWDDITGTTATLAVGYSAPNITFTATSADNLSLFFYEVD